MGKTESCEHHFIDVGTEFPDERCLHCGASRCNQCWHVMSADDRAEGWHVCSEIRYTGPNFGYEREPTEIDRSSQESRQV